MLFIHVPHTSGRSLKSYLLRRGDNIITVHNAEQIKELDKEYSIKYFILREPTERVWKEFLHYSENLKIGGRVNHLNILHLKKANPSFDPKNISHYISLEVNRNVCCKFLLLRTDFNIPVTETDLNYLKENISSFKYDIFKKPMTYPVLSTIIDPIDANLKYITDEAILISQEAVSEIIRLNTFDIMLFNFLL